MPLILNGSTGISGTDGSAGTPALQGTDGNTGMFFPAADQIAFAEGGVEAMRLDASGNVGIGTTTMGYRLVVSSNGGTDATFVSAAGGAAYVGAVGAKPLIFETSGTERGRFTSGGEFNVGNSAVNRLRFTYNSFTGGATIGPDSNGGNTFLTFGTSNAGSYIERARVTDGGNFGIGTTSPNSLLDVRGNAIVSTNVNTPGTTGWQGVSINAAVGALDISRNGSNVAAFYHTSNAGGTSGSPVGTISITTTNTSYNTSSDYRLKENVVPLTDASTRLGALKPSRFNFISDPSRTFDGFLAHEAAEVVPEAVTGEKDEVNEDGKPVYQGIDHSKLVPLLTAALQEALTEIAALKARVAALEAR